MFKLFKYLGVKDWILMVLSAGLIAGCVWLNLKIPEFMSQITTLIQTGGSVSEILIQGAFMLSCALADAIVSAIVGFCVSKVATGFAAKLREKVFVAIQNLSEDETKKFSVPSLITRTTNDITQIQNFLAMGMQSLIKAPIMAIWAICVISSKSWQWTVTTAVAVGLILVVVTLLIIFVIPRFRKVQKQIDALNNVTREGLTGVRVVRAYNAEKFEENKFEKANDTLTRTQLFTGRAFSVLNPFMVTLTNCLSLAIYWIGALIISQATSGEKLGLFSDMVVFMSYAMLVVAGFVMLIMVFIMLPRAIVSGRRISEVLSSKSEVCEGKGAEAKGEGEIEFRNVGFKYPGADAYVLQNVNFKAKKGQTVAFIGSTGSGKSTLINLVPRFYDATEGEILIDGNNIKDYTFDQLNKKIGYVSQRAVIFSGTIRSNIAYGKDSQNLTDEEVEKALEIAQGGNIIKEKGGLDAEITQAGSNLSGGQKQRLSIARALAKKPEIMIFDDSFSALDYRTDKKLRTALKKNSKTTNLIVAQRIGTILNADEIIVLEKGQVVGQGTHKELMQNCKVYREIALSQLSKEELE